MIVAEDSVNGLREGQVKLKPLTFAPLEHQDDWQGAECFECFVHQACWQRIWHSQYYAVHAFPWILALAASTCML